MRRNVIRIVLIVVILGAAASIGLWWQKHYASKTDTHTVAAGPLLRGVTVSGTIRCKRRAAIAAEIVAAVKVLSAKEGQAVEKHQVLVQLDDRTINAQCAEARARVELAKQQLAELQAGPRKEEIVKAREDVNSAKSDVTYTEKDYEATCEAKRRNAGAQREVDRALNRMEKAKSALGSSQAQLELLLAGTRPEQIAGASAEVGLAEANLRKCDAMRLKYVLLAPHDGIVTVRYVNTGEIVSPGQILLRVEDVESIEIRAQVQESQLQGVKKGSVARVLADAHPDVPLKAVVEQILPRVDPERGTITALLKLSEKPTVALMDGMAADIAIIQQEKEAAVRIPVAAIGRREDKAFVWVKEGSGFTRRTITPGISDEYWVEVVSGLEAGDVIRMP